MANFHPIKILISGEKNFLLGFCILLVILTLGSCQVYKNKGVTTKSFGGNWNNSLNISQTNKSNRDSLLTVKNKIQFSEFKFLSNPLSGSKNTLHTAGKTKLNFIHYPIRKEFHIANFINSDSNFVEPPNKKWEPLTIIGLGLLCASLTVMLATDLAALGLLLLIGAMVLGLIGKHKIEKYPEKYKGRGLAIAVAVIPMVLLMLALLIALLIISIFLAL
ncbi:MAG: hypothetical protein KG003_02065 [Bacteroidetes bacterium]|nr:hypothetical protein [Bacteroidota bacterium]